MPVADLPSTIGRYSISLYREVTFIEWIAEGPDAVIQLCRLAHEVPLEQIRERLAARVGHLDRAVGAGHSALLRPCDFGVDQWDGVRFGWLAAESPGLHCHRFRPTRRALASLISGLAHLHQRGCVHGAVSADALWLRANGDAALAPWLGCAEQRPCPAEVDGELDASVDVHAVAALLPNEPSYRRLSNWCRSARDVDARALLQRWEGDGGAGPAASAAERSETVRSLSLIRT